MHPRGRDSETAVSLRKAAARAAAIRRPIVGRRDCVPSGLWDPAGLGKCTTLFTARDSILGVSCDLALFFCVVVLGVSQAQGDGKGGRH